MKRLIFMLILFIAVLCMSILLISEEKTSIYISIRPDFGDATDIIGAKITMINNNGIKSHIYKKKAKGTHVLFKKIVPGTYTLNVEHKDYFSASLENVIIRTTVHGLNAYLIRKGTAGGIVFYDKGSVIDGWRFLEAAPANTEFNADWNSAIIRCSELVINGKTGWSLPNKDQLNHMYQNLHLKDLGDFGKGNNSDSWINWAYWSSSQHNDNLAWAQYFGNGGQGNVTKSSTYRVRAVLAF